MIYFASKGLFIRELQKNKYVIEDIFGTSSLPIYCTETELDGKTKEIANTQKLVQLSASAEHPNFEDFKWNAIEKLFLNRLEHAYHRYILNEKELKNYHLSCYVLPIAYFEFGYGDGSKEGLELVNKQFLKFCEEMRNERPSLEIKVNQQLIDNFLIINTLKRIIDDILALIRRSLLAYVEILIAHRACIKKSCETFHLFNTNEVKHKGNETYHIATATTNLVISLCTSLDLSAKLIDYLNSFNLETQKFKPAKGKHFEYIKLINSKSLPQNVLGQIKEKMARCRVATNELIQFRNDLIHSTSAIELETIFVGTGTHEINYLNLFYSAHYARDCSEAGNPIRYLGREYFTGDKQDIEIKAMSWISTVINYHLEIGNVLHKYFESHPKT